jgi:hypothetical protein
MNILKDEKIHRPITLKKGDSLGVTYTDKNGTRYLTSFSPTSETIVDRIIVERRDVLFIEGYSMTNVISIHLGKSS